MPPPSSLPQPRSILTIGNFDGVHLGHRALLEHARSLAASASTPQGPAPRVIALTFDPHPNTLLKPAAIPDRLTTFDQRAALLRAAGADEVVRLEPTREQLSLSAEDFVNSLVARYHPIAFVEGSDFHFGKARAGNVTTLAAMGRAKDAATAFSVHVVDPVEVDLSDQHLVRASSSLVRWLLANGRVQDAARVLGRDYELSGVVTQGDRMGRDLGFPTANIKTSCVLPLSGVYAALATLPNNTTVPAAVSVGPRPTFDAPEPRLEAFLLLDHQPAKGHPIPGLSEYNWPLSLRFKAFLREQLKFDSLPDLIRQMARDCDRTLELVHPTLALP